MRIVLFLASLLTLALRVDAQSPPDVKQFNLEKGVALQGYDPVAYIDQNKAVKGTKSLAHSVDGVTYYFSTPSNRDLFVKDHHKYEPQYGGWCAYAMGASGEKVEVDPETFKVENGKLYLFYNSLFNNTLPKWNNDETKLKSSADKNWAALTK